MPRPSLPVLSAISCSTQRPNDAMLRRNDERALVAAGQRQLAERRAEAKRVAAAGTRVGRRGDAAVEQLRDVDAGDGGRRESEVRKRGVSSADIAGVDEGLAEAVLVRERFERRAGVGDGDEVLARASGLRSFDQVVEVREERQRLDGGAGLRRDEEERASRCRRAR